MINWKVRLKQKTFWAAMISAILLLIQVVAAVFGAKIDLSDLGGKLLAVLDVVFMILVLLGIVNDPTTQGIGDSVQALKYTEPKAKGK